MKIPIRSASRIAALTALVLAAVGLNLAGPVAPAIASGSFQEHQVWTKTEGGATNHTLFGLAVAANDDVLAFSEKRIIGSDDASHDIVYKRSTNAGVSWGTDSTLESTNDNPDGNFKADGVTPNPASWANPTPVVDTVTGRIVVFYALNESSVSSRVFYRASSNNGATWSSRVEVTSLFASNTHGWTFHLPGPGHGIALANGRLLVQVWHRKDLALPTADRDYGVTVIGSDDHGLSWSALGEVPVSDAFPINESRLVQRNDGSVLVNARVAGLKPRVQSVSVDNGASWSAPSNDTVINTFVSVDASMTRLTGGPGSSDLDRVLFARPDSTTERENMTVGLSYDGGTSFAFEKVIYSGMSHYSDMVALPDGTALLVYGKDGNDSSRGLTVQAAKFDVDWITDGRDSLATGLVSQVEVGPTTVGSSSGKPTSVYTDAAASGGSYFQYHSTAVADYIEVKLPIYTAGTYQLVFHGKRSTNRAIVQASVGGVNVGMPFDPYHATAKDFIDFNLGTFVATSSGTKIVRFTVVGHNVATTGYEMSLDTVTATLQ